MRHTLTLFIFCSNQAREMIVSVIYKYSLNKRDVLLAVEFPPVLDKSFGLE